MIGEGLRNIEQMGTKKDIRLLFMSVTLVLSLLQNPVDASKKPYIVYLGVHSHGPQATVEDHNRATDSHYELLGSVLGSKEKARDSIFYSYNKHINGFAATLEEEEANQLKSYPGIISVFESINYELHTTRSWGYLQVEGADGVVADSSIWTVARFGNDSIIANIDTGVWPESESFKDDGYGDIPPRWKGGCQQDAVDGVTCNRKLIGARSFYRGFEAKNKVHVKVTSPRDTIGHGTHTLSTAAGGFVPGAGLLNNAYGTAKGGAPGARVAVYKTCWRICDQPDAPPGADCLTRCNDADNLAAFDAAIHDGVDVISYSVGLGMGMYDYFIDPTSIGAFHAVANRITVVCSAGNSGPMLLGSVTNAAPWIITVGASTMDRDFRRTLTLGNNKQIQGRCFTLKSLDANTRYPLINSLDAKRVNAADKDANFCLRDSIDPLKVSGKIVVCKRGGSTSIKDDFPVVNGAVGTILIDSKDRGDDFLLFPFTDNLQTMITEQDGDALRSYINSAKSAADVSMSAPTTELGKGLPAPAVAFFSSLGPNYRSPLILKPDVTAPGVNILAAYSQSPSKKDPLDPPAPFELLSGTSMSCPVVAGVVGLLKTLHPDWSPAAIRSAIMTTARIMDDQGKRIRDFLGRESSPWHYGSGNIRPERAMDPGLVYDVKMTDYLDFLCALGYNASQMAVFTDPPYQCAAEKKKDEDLNYPSITVRYPTTSVTATRTLKNVGPPGTYKVEVIAPIGMTVTVDPPVLEFKTAGEEKTYKVEVKPNNPSDKPKNVLGRITWSDGSHYVCSHLFVLNRW